MPELTIHALAEQNLFPNEIRIEDLETLGCRENLSHKEHFTE